MWRAVALLSLLGFCERDETVAGHGGGADAWVLQEIDGEAFTAEAWLRFGEGGAVTGQGPCASFTAQQTAPYPWFAIEDLRADGPNCPALAREVQMLEALSAMTLSEVGPSVMILSSEDGREMIFSRTQ